MELAVHRQRAHVLLQVELVRHVGGVEDEVEGERPRFRPVFVFRADELLGAQGQRVFLLFRCVRNGVDFGAQGGGPEEAEVAESATKKSWLVVGRMYKVGCTHIPRMAIFLPGPAWARTRGL